MSKEFVPDAYMIRTTDKDGKAYGGFQWPTEVGAIVEAPDWNGAAICGYGLHGLLDGNGNWGLLSQDGDALWWVIGVLRSECVEIDSEKHKAPRCRVEYVGNMANAMTIISRHRQAEIWKNAKASEDTQATTGDRAPAATTGDRAPAATTGEGAPAATTGDRAPAATTGDRAPAATTGDRAPAATTGEGAPAATTGEGAPAATTGDYAPAATTGDYAPAATTGDRAPAATTGDYAPAATTGDRAPAATTGEGAIAAALGAAGTASASAGGAIMLAAFDTTVWPYKLIAVRASMVGENGIEPGKTYRLTVAGEFEEVR
jgi:hypothetical protein